MKTRFLPLQLGVAGLALGLAGSALAASHGGDTAHGHEKASHAMEQVDELIAVITSANDSDVKGTVHFKKVADGIEITAKISGLEADTEHAFHIHEFGNIEAEDGTSAGGHYNPEGHDHGLPEQEMRHAGDLGNLETDGDGEAEKTFTVDNVTLAGSMNPIIGRSVVIHAKKDDGGQPTGNAGDRIGVGVIGVSKVSEKDSAGGAATE